MIPYKKRVQVVNRLMSIIFDLVDLSIVDKGGKLFCSKYTSLAEESQAVITIRCVIPSSGAMPVAASQICCPSFAFGRPGSCTLSSFSGDVISWLSI